MNTICHFCREQLAYPGAPCHRCNRRLSDISDTEVKKRLEKQGISILSSKTGMDNRTEWWHIRINGMDIYTDLDGLLKYIDN